VKNILPVAAVLALAAVGFFAWKNQTPQTSPPTNQTQEETPKTSPTSFTFTNPKKSAHYETNTPAHGSTLAGTPINVVIDFNFDLAKPSEIKILKERTDYGTGETIIDTNKLSMRRTMKSDSPDGLYTVDYKACWPDKSCHDGTFQFAIDRSQAKTYDDQTGKKEVTIKMSEVMFKPQNIKLTRGTKVTWVNDDSAEHYVNTDSHPSHTYSPTQNSKALKKGESFTLTFDQAGIYPYHCSAHASSMTGSLLIE